PRVQHLVGLASGSWRTPVSRRSDRGRTRHDPPCDRARHDRRSRDLPTSPQRHGRGPRQRSCAHAQSQGHSVATNSMDALAQELQPAVPHYRRTADLPTAVWGGRRRDGVRTVRAGHPHRHRHQSARVPHRAGSGPHHGLPRHLHQPRGGRPLPRDRPQDQVMSATTTTPPPSSAAGAALSTTRPKARKLPIVRWVSILILLIALALLIAGRWLTPYDPVAQDLTTVFAGPSWQHWLGTDDLGRDILSRMIAGGQATIAASLFAVFVALVLGLPVGIAAGYFGGWVDTVLMRIVDTLLAFPAIVLAIGVTASMGIGLVNAMLAV